MHHHQNSQFIHHKKNINTALIREAVFGMEDGMVSTFGAVTGIAAATANPFTVILSGSILIAVESISMAVGSYLSSKSEKAIDDRKIAEETLEIKQFPEEEKKELVGMFVVDGWPKKFAIEMAEVASKNKKILLKEMAYRELKVFPDHQESPLKNALVMGLSYIVGGLIPLIPYFLFVLPYSLYFSLPVTLIGLFSLGALTTRYSKRPWWRVGFEMLILGAVAALVGYFVGQAIK